MEDGFIVVGNLEGLTVVTAVGDFLELAVGKIDGPAVIRLEGIRVGKIVGFVEAMDGFRDGLRGVNEGVLVVGLRVTVVSLAVGTAVGTIDGLVVLVGITVALSGVAETGLLVRIAEGTFVGT